MKNFPIGILLVFLLISVSITIVTISSRRNSYGGIGEDIERLSWKISVLEYTYKVNDWDYGVRVKAQPVLRYINTAPDSVRMQWNALMRYVHSFPPPQQIVKSGNAG